MRARAARSARACSARIERQLDAAAVGQHVDEAVASSRTRDQFQRAALPSSGGCERCTRRDERRRGGFGDAAMERAHRARAANSVKRQRTVATWRRTFN